MDNRGQMNRRRFFKMAGLGAIFTAFGLDPVRDLAAAEPDPDTEVSVTIDLGRTTINAIKQGTSIGSRMIGFAGIELNNAVSNYLRSAYKLIIGRCEAESIIIQIGSALPLEMPLTMEVRGRNMINGFPEVISLNDEEIRIAIGNVVDQIVRDVTGNLKYAITPDLAEVASANGVVLKGEFGKLRRLDERFQQATGLKFTVV